MWLEPPIDLNRLPREPGVYRMLDAGRKVLYVGKARNLRKRVSSYFQRRPESPRIEAMARQVRDIELTVTRSEAEALLLEHNLIKQLKPRYNVLLKDAKSYPYILLTAGPFPRLMLHRGPRKPAGDYFGPFPNAGAVHATIELMQKLFRLRDCTDASFRNRSRPCLQYQIGRCTAPCCGKVAPGDYAAQAKAARAFLHGENQALIEQWQREMGAAAERLDFEAAARLRDRIRMLRDMIAQGASDLPDNADAIAIIRGERGAACCVGVRRAGRDLGTHLVRVAQAADAGDQEILQALLIERYAREPAPAIVLTDSREADTAELARLLRVLAGKKRDVRRPARGALRDWMLEVRKNGEQNLATRGGGQRPALESLAGLLALPEPPARIAAVDNAHLGGRQMAAAIVYADENGPDKAHYRRYRLDDAPAGDDYAAMEAVLGRFFRTIRDGELPKPDLMLIDGGKGQLAVAVACARECGLGDLRLVAVAKGARRKFGEETLWPAWTMQPLRPGPDSPAMRLIARVRDEAHRFAGSYLRKRKKQAMLRSRLEGIPGVGPARRTALLRHFGGIEGVKKASREQLCEAPGISTELAERIFRHLHG